MKRKSYGFYSNLWKESSSEPSSRINLVINNFDSYCKKAIDGLCLKADLCESVSEYILSICSDMETLIEQGVTREQFLKHDLVVEKIRRMGQDLMEHSNFESDLFYVGVFIDYKVPQQWFKISFFSLVKGLISMCLKEAMTLPKSIKTKIRKSIREDNFNLYCLYFVPNKLKKSS